MMFQFFKKPGPALNDFSALKIDFHNHILPGIDDGAADESSSLRLMQRMQELGYDHLICTPHVMSELYPNTRDIILLKKDQLLELAQREGLYWAYLDVAAEYFIDEQFVRLLRTEPLLTLPGNRVLVEMSFFQAYPDLHGVLFDLQMKGYKPVLAHPERYRFLQNADSFENLRNLGCEFQVNLLSLTGYYHSAVQAAARTLQQRGWIDFLCTDLHHERHADLLQKALQHKYVATALQNPELKNIELAAAARGE